MRLDHLLAEIGPDAPPRGAERVEIAAIADDHRRVRPGSLYCCVRGRRADGHDHAGAAVAAGAVALVGDHRLPLDVPQALVPDVRAVLGPLAARFHDHPSRSLDVVGVTGTNGKTTTVALLHSVLEAAGRPADTIGTLTPAAGSGDVARPPTTPGALDLQARLAELLHGGASTVAMEVSSHAMVQHRVAGTRFAVAVFTNLTPDHLDLHHTMDDYFAAKAALFEPGLAERAVVNADDAYGRRLLAAGRVPTRAYSLADVTDLEVGVAASTGTWQGRRLHVPLGGAFNVANALAAGTAALELGIAVDDVVEGIAATAPVAGRYEVVVAGPPFAVVVDYAHTPDGLEQVLRTSRAAAGEHRVLVVFGCGGDRDREKRPLMGDIASRLADVVVLTSDNPRGEDPDRIIEEVARGADGPADLTVEPDRRRAVAAALAAASPGDVVVVAGKGHETTQTFADRTVPFDDRAVVREELSRLRPAQLAGGGH